MCRKILSMPPAIGNSKMINALSIRALLGNIFWPQILRAWLQPKQATPKEGCCLFWGFPRNTPILSNVWVNVIENLNCLKFLPPPSPTHKLKCFCQICEKLSLCYPNFSATWSHRSITRGKNRVKSLHRTNPQTIQQLSFYSFISYTTFTFLGIHRLE